MKELYISPELNLLCFAPEEKLMSQQEIDFDALLQNGYENPVSYNPNYDIEIPIDIPLN